MKLSLAVEKGIHILIVESWIKPDLEAASPTLANQANQRDIQVLKAGLEKLLLTGKNRIIVELPQDFQEMPSDAIRELATMDRLAGELSGRIVLACVSKPLQQKLSAFSKPPVISSFATRQEALNEFTKPEQPSRGPHSLVGGLAGPPKSGESRTGSATPGAPSQVPGTASPGTAGSVAPGRAAAPLEGTSHAPLTDSAEAAYLERIHHLEAENQLLREQVLRTTLERRNEALSAEAAGRIQKLERKIANLLDENKKLTDPHAPSSKK